MEGNEESATVVELNPWTEYEFRVIATNTLGTGEPSNPSAKERTMDAGKSPGQVNKISLPGTSRESLAKGHGKRRHPTSHRPQLVFPFIILS